MRLSAEEFRALDAKRVSLIGTAGVGKTRLATLLRRFNWFHYSADYRIGTRYLREPILDHIKQQAMRVPFLRDLLRSDSIYINNNITVDNLDPVTSFLGKLGDPEAGGLALAEFARRQNLYREALVATLSDVPEFIRKARSIYGYDHFINDTAGSTCEIDCPEALDLLARHTVVIYIRPTGRLREQLLGAADPDHRPLCYRSGFLESELAVYMRERALAYVALVDPGDFYGWILPRLYAAREALYEEIAARHGYVVTTEEIDRVEDEQGFLDLVARALDDPLCRGRGA